MKLHIHITENGESVMAFKKGTMFGIQISINDNVDSLLKELETVINKYKL